MNAFILLIPFLLIAFINEGAIKRAGYFAPLQGNEKIAYVIYQMANIGIFIYFFLSIQKEDNPFINRLSSFHNSEH